MIDLADNKSPANGWRRLAFGVSRAKRLGKWLFCSLKGWLLMLSISSVFCGHRSYVVYQHEKAIASLREQEVLLWDERFNLVGPDWFWVQVVDRIVPLPELVPRLPRFLSLVSYDWMIIPSPGISDRLARDLSQCVGPGRIVIVSLNDVPEPADNIRVCRSVWGIELAGPWITDEVIVEASRLPNIDLVAVVSTRPDYRITEESLSKYKRFNSAALTHLHLEYHDGTAPNIDDLLGLIEQRTNP